MKGRSANIKPENAKTRRNKAMFKATNNLNKNIKRKTHVHSEMGVNGESKKSFEDSQ